MILLTMIRRIKQPLLQFFEKHPLTDAEKSFILGCINSQKKFPQLTHRQWQVICDIKERYEKHTQ